MKGKDVGTAVPACLNVALSRGGQVRVATRHGGCASARRFGGNISDGGTEYVVIWSWYIKSFLNEEGK